MPASSQIEETETGSKVTKSTVPPPKKPNKPIELEKQVEKTIEKTIEKKISAQQLITNSLNYLKSDRITGKESESKKTFGFPNSDKRTNSEITNSTQQNIESYKLTNGNTMIKSTSFLGTPYCAEIQDADPLIEGSVGQWYITTCGPIKPKATINWLGFEFNF